MKILHHINCFIYFTTIGFYASVYLIILGAYAQIALGVTQLIIALILILSFNKLNKKVKKMIVYYWIITLSLLSFLLYKHYSQSLSNEMISLFIIPMLIASYFVYLTYLNQKDIK